MDGRELRRLLRQGGLLGRDVVIKATTAYARDGVVGGVVIAADDGPSLLIAIHGRLDDRLFLSAAQVASVGNVEPLETRYLTPESRAALAFDLTSFGVGRQALPEVAALAVL